MSHCRAVPLVVIAIVAAIVGVLLVTAAHAGDMQGTTVDELAQLQLPRPSEVTVALLPFWDYKNLSRHTEVCRHHLHRYFTRHGFTVVPPALVSAVVSQDTKLEPGVPMRRDDAVRIAAKVGADWAIYGNVLQLETYEKKSAFSKRKKAQVSIKLTVVAADSGEVLFWRQRFDTSGGHGGFTKRATSMERTAADVCLTRILKDFFAALPDHELQQEAGSCCAPLAQGKVREAYEADPGSVEATIAYAQSLICWHKADDAESILARAVRRDKTNADLHFWHGVSLYALGEAAAAQAEWQQTVQLAPAHPYATHLLAVFASAQSPAHTTEGMSATAQ